MTQWLKFLVFVLIFGATKASHFRLVALAVLGLAGLFMMQSITQNGGRNFLSRFSAAEIATRILSKRSIALEDVPDQINWDTILLNDVSTCTRSFICQLSATPVEKLTNEEKITLAIIRKSTRDPKWSAKQFLMAMQIGLKTKSKTRCKTVYTKCPYSRATMQQLLNLLSDKS